MYFVYIVIARETNIGSVVAFSFSISIKKKKKKKKATNYLISALFNKTAQLKSRNMIHDVHYENKIDAQTLRSFVSK